MAIADLKVKGRVKKLQLHGSLSGGSSSNLGPLIVTENGTYDTAYEAASFTWDENTEYDGTLSVDSIPLRYKKVASLTVPDDVIELDTDKYFLRFDYPDGTGQSAPLSDYHLAFVDGAYVTEELAFAIVWIKEAALINEMYGASFEDNTVYVTDYLWLVSAESTAGVSFTLTAPGKKLDGFSSVTVDVKNSAIVGVWRFNTFTYTPDDDQLSIILPSSEDFNCIQDVSFTCVYNGETINMSKIEYEYVDDDGYYRLFFYDTEIRSYTVRNSYQAEDLWNSEIANTIDFGTEPQVVSETFKKLMEQIATRQEESTDGGDANIVPLTMTDNGTVNTMYLPDTETWDSTTEYDFSATVYGTALSFKKSEKLSVPDSIGMLKSDQYSGTVNMDGEVLSTPFSEAVFVELFYDGSAYGVEGSEYLVWWVKNAATINEAFLTTDFEDNTVYFTNYLALCGFTEWTVSLTAPGKETADGCLPVTVALPIQDELVIQSSRTSYQDFDDGVFYRKVTVNPLPAEVLNVTPTTSAQTFAAANTSCYKLVHVAAANLDSVVHQTGFYVKTYPTKVYYTTDEWLDTDGIVCVRQYSDGTEEETRSVSIGMISGFPAARTRPGKHVLTIQKYDNAWATFEVTIYAGADDYTFQIDGKLYFARHPATWSDWVSSDFNSSGVWGDTAIIPLCAVNGDHVYTTDGTKKLCDSNGEAVLITDVVHGDNAYQLVSV